MSHTVSIKKNVIFNTAYQVLILIAPLITTPYISRTIGADGVGTYSFTNSVVMYFTMFAALGTAGYGTREISRNRNNKKIISKLFLEIELLTVFTTIVCLGLWLVFILIAKTYKTYYLILSLTLLATLFDISWFYAGIEEFKYTIIQNAFFKIAGIVSLFIFINSKEDTYIYVLIMALTTLLGNMSMWIYLPRFVDKVPFKSVNVFRHFRETLIYFIPTIAISIYTILDKTLIGLITHDEFENGYYEQATKVVNMIKAITFYSVNLVIGSRTSLLFAEGRYQEIKKLIMDSMDFILLIGYGAVFGLVGISRSFVPIFFGEGYEYVTVLLYWMSPLIIIISISNCLGNQYYTPAGLRAQSSKYIISGSVLNLVLNLCLIPRLGSVGAVIGSIAAEGLISSLYLLNCNGYLTVSNLFRMSVKRIIAGLLMSWFVLLIGKYVILDAISKSILQVASGAIIYAVVLILLKDSMLIGLIGRLSKRNN